MLDKTKLAIEKASYKVYSDLNKKRKDKECTDKVTKTINDARRRTGYVK